MGEEFARVITWPFDKLIIPEKQDPVQPAPAAIPQAPAVEIPKTPEPPQVAGESPEAAASKATEIIKQKKKAIARAKTIFTTPLGLSQSEEAATAKKYLLGR